MFRKSITQLITLLTFWVIGTTAVAQVRYSSDPNYILSKKEGTIPFITLFESAYPDTSIGNIHNYAPRNYTGNLGLMQPDYFVRYKSNPLGFRVYELPYGDDIILPNQAEYFKTKGPFASLSGFAGSKNEQTFRLLFSHTTKNNLNLTVKFNRFGSLGYYNKQQTFTNNFYTTLNYNTKNNRFGFTSYFLFNRVKHQENGGVKYDTIIKDQPTIGKDLLQINLSSARRDNRIMSASINPWFRLNKNDSSVLSHFIDYKINYAGNYYWYTDQSIASDNFYNTFYLDTVKTNDSTNLQQLINHVNYTLKVNKLNIGASAGYSYEHNRLHQHKDSIMINQVLHATLFYHKLFLNSDSSTINKNKVIHSEINYNSIFDGANTNDSKLEWKSELKFRVNEQGVNTKKTSSIFINLLSEHRHPDFIYNYWYSNHFRWTNNFKSVDLFQFNAGAVHYGSGLSGNILWQNIGHYLYMDSTLLPKQSNIIISNWAYVLNYNKVLFKHLGLRINLTYQSTNKTALMRVAPLQAKTAIYYTGNLFKRNLQLQIGIQGEYYQSFKSLAYMPAYNMYYLQNRHSAGEYPFVDVFLNARIKPVQFFLKVENALYGLVGSNYDFVPGYYQPDRAFRFGITWLFFD